MPEYRAPVDDMRFVINELADLSQLARLPAFESITPDVAGEVVEQAGRFANEILSPLNVPGDREGVRLVDGEVKPAKGFREAYRQFAEAGWVGLTGEPQFGGQGLPHLVASAASEMWAAANSSFSNCPELGGGAILALQSHATPELKQKFLPRMLSGEWTGTMCLTEPQAGSDLAAVQTRAEADGDRYRLFGRKIFITWGDHDMTPNICHLVLGRAAGAPQGVKGISLFLVPKYCVNADGTLGARNDIHPVAIEHKLGLHASPTCVLAMGDNGGAEGYLVGGLHEGIVGMFTMMNLMRLGVGLQGIGLAERAYQQAVSYARERVQGRSPDGKSRVTIVKHADVRRMLLTTRALLQAGRAVAYVAASHLDLAHHAPDAEQRRQHLARAELLTPIVKGWGTEIAQEAAALGVQVHGGMGFIEETGAAQHLRDARITTIYEGTNGIQAMDLVGRKVLRDGGVALSNLLHEIASIDDVLGKAELAFLRQPLLSAIRDASDSARLIVGSSAGDEHFVGATAFHFLMLMGVLCGGWQLARSAIIARRQLQNKAPNAEFYRAKIATARVFADQVLPRAASYAAAIRAGSESLMTFEDEWLNA